MSNLMYVSDLSGNLLRVDPTTLVTEVVGQTSVVLTDIAFSPSGVLYGISYTGLYEIDPETAETFYVGPLGLSDANALAFNLYGEAFVAQAGSAGLYSLNVDTGQTTLIGSNSEGRVSAGDLLCLDDRVFLSTADNYIVELNPANGQIINSAYIGISDLYGLGSVYGVVYGFADNMFYQIDPETGTSIPMASVEGTATFSGAATSSFLSYADQPRNLSGTAGRDWLFGGILNDHLSGLEGSDLLYGGDGDDVLFGGSGADLIEGGAGSDYLDGESGFDIASYQDSEISVTVDVENPVSNWGGAQGDAHISIEGVYGSRFGDLIFGGHGSSILEGLGGNDSLLGGLGDDLVYGGTGDDNLYGGAGADYLDGGLGFDYARYDSATSGVVVYLTNSNTNNGEAAGDRFISVEGIFGSSYGDFLVGNGGDNILQGLGGDDKLLGSFGDDLLFGGGGNDDLWGGAGADYLDGGSGFNAARYDIASTGITAVLVNSTLNTGEAAGDRYTNIRGLIGSNNNDNLIGDNGDNLIHGQAGNDSITGYSGNDTVFGGSGADLFFFQASSGHDVIADFGTEGIAHDTIFIHSNVNGSDITDFASLIGHMSQVGSDLLIDLGAGNAVALQQIQLAQLNESHFAFG